MSSARKRAFKKKAEDEIKQLKEEIQSFKSKLALQSALTQAAGFMYDDLKKKYDEVTGVAKKPLSSTIPVVEHL